MQASLRQRIEERTRVPAIDVLTVPINPPPRLVASPPSQSLNRSLGSRKESAASESFSRTAAPAALAADASAVLPLIAHSEDPDGIHDGFSKREQQCVAELNELRQNPKAYAHKMSLQMELQEPFVSHKRMHYAELNDFRLEKEKEQLELQRRLEELHVKEKAEKTVLQTQWATEDVERAKKSKKSAAVAANRKRGSVVPTEETDIAADRAAIVNEIETRYANERKQTQILLDTVSLQLRKATQGTKVMGQCMRRIAAIDPLPALRLNRGLCLAARDACDLGPSAVIHQALYAGKYGAGARYGASVFVGDESVSQTVMEMLLGLQDPQLNGRSALLDLSYDSVGCGWRADKLGQTNTMFIVSRHYEELRAISEREHLPLLQVKHVLRTAVSERPGMAVVLKGSLGVELVEPSHHPVNCGNVARLVFRCAQGTQICGVLCNISEAEPRSPLRGDGRSLTHRLEDDLLEMLVVLPYRGEFFITLFASGPSFSSGFERIGKVLLAAYDWDPCSSVISLPVATGDFAKRNCRLESPLRGHLAPLTTTVFTIVVPLSGYLLDELALVDTELSSIDTKHSQSDTTLDSLELAEKEAAEEHAALESSCGPRMISLTEELVAIAKEITRKRGKELERVKGAQGELEEQRRGIEQRLNAASKKLSEARAKVEAFRRAARQVSAHQKRLTRERERLEKAIDRSSPLQVEISVGERRAIAPPVAGDMTRYSLSLRTPPTGHVCLYINGLLELSWNVSDD